LFSATLPAWVAGISARHVQQAVTIKVDADIPAPPQIEHVVYEVESAAKLGALRTLLDDRGDEAVIVFGRTKHGVKKLAQRLEALGYPAAALQGNLSQNARERVMDGFRSGRVPILLATNVAARGLDVPEVGQVINYELPESAEWLTHRVGRTGRMGRAGRAITLLSTEDAAKWRQFEKALGRRHERRPWTGTDEPASTDSGGRISALAERQGGSERTLSQGRKPRVQPKASFERTESGRLKPLAEAKGGSERADARPLKRRVQPKASSERTDARGGDAMRGQRQPSWRSRRRRVRADGVRTAA
jgi:superfamily II DNA/RNA helicase